MKMYNDLQRFHYLLLQFEFTAWKNKLKKIVARQKVRKNKKYQISSAQHYGESMGM